MKVLRFLSNRFFAKKPFFYSWEQRAFERRQEMLRARTQSVQRVGRD